MLKIINEKNFESEIIKSDKVTLVDFYADWCGPCRMVAPVLEKIGSEQSTFDVAKINVDENQMLAAQYGVMSIPTMLIFKNGKVVNTLVGFKPENTLIQEVIKHV